VTAMSRSRRVFGAAPARKPARRHVLSFVAHPVHVVTAVTLFQAGCSGCVVPPPLSVQADAGPDSPPIIEDLRDPSLNSHRPPDTLIVNTAIAQGASFDLTAYDTDLSDDLTLKWFIAYDPTSPSPARVTCTTTPVTGMPTDRTATCPEMGLCGNSDLGLTQRLEIDVYDRPVDPNSPYRDDPGGLSSTWTFDLSCINQP